MLDELLEKTGATQTLDAVVEKTNFGELVLAYQVIGQLGRLWLIGLIGDDNLHQIAIALQQVEKQRGCIVLIHVRERVCWGGEHFELCEIYRIVWYAARRRNANLLVVALWPDVKNTQFRWTFVVIVSGVFLIKFDESRK